MVIGINTNKQKDKDLKSTKSFIELLKQAKIDCLISDNLKDDFSNLDCYDKNSKLDILAVFGGDGTILRTVPDAVKLDIPILGINLGNLGFLNEIGNLTLQNIADAIKTKKYKVKERFLLQTYIEKKLSLALNDIVVKNSDSKISNVIKLETYLDDILIDKFVSDGIIISTPTGSTAYSLSAGGPILSPDLSVLVITPICPHSLHNRPIVVSDDKKIKIKLITENADVFADGQFLGKLTKDEDILVEKSQRTCKFLSFSDESFYVKLLTKLNNWTNIK
ncbi:MAG: NAD(+)/NADH kinase [Firmicutes bacterium]|nr:NAD(+)/NADH kinase [Bacillota bacterium]